MAKRIAAALIFVLSILGLILWPKLVMLRCLSSDVRAFGALSELRGKVAAYRETHGRFPADLAEVGVPALDLYSYDPKSDRVHRHHRIRETVVRPGAEMPLDEGKWIYDPQTGLVLLGCSGTDTKHRRPWYFY